MNDKKRKLIAHTKITLDANSKRVYDETNGYLRIADNPFTKEQVTQYRGREIPEWDKHGLKANELYNVYRPASELSKPETIASLIEIPLLLEHATYDPQNPPKDRTIGTAGSNPYWDPPYLKNTLTFHNAKAIRLLESGAMKELSLGYYYDPKFEKGKTKDGLKYDVIMTNIRANHIALVEEGRAGHDVAVHDSKPKTTKKGLKTMPIDVQDDDDKIQMLLQLAIELAKQSGVKIPNSDSDDDPTEDEDEEQGGDPLAPENDNPETEDEDEDPTEDEDEEPIEDEDEDPTEDEDEEPVADNELSDDDLLAILKEAGIKANSDIIEGVKAALSAISSKQAPTTDSKRSLRNRIKNATISARISREVRKYRALDKAKVQAAREVRGVLGNVDALAFDSAGAIYRKALRKSGYSLKEVRKLKTAEARACFRGLSRGKAASRAIAKDSAKSRKKSNAEKSLDLIMKNFR